MTHPEAPQRMYVSRGVPPRSGWSLLSGGTSRVSSRRARAQCIKPAAPTVATREAARLVTELAQTQLTGRAIARVTGVGRSRIARLMSAHVNSVVDDLIIQEDTLVAIRAVHADLANRARR